LIRIYDRRKPKVIVMVYICLIKLNKYVICVVCSVNVIWLQFMGDYWTFTKWWLSWLLSLLGDCGLWFLVNDLDGLVGGFAVGTHLSAFCPYAWVAVILHFTVIFQIFLTLFSNIFWTLFFKYFLTVIFQIFFDL